MLRAWLLLHREWGLSCALRLLVEKQSHLVLRLLFLLAWLVLLLLFRSVPGSSGRQQRQEVSHSSRRCCRSSSDGTGRAMKKRHRGRSPSPGCSSRCQEKSYRSSSESSEDDRAEASPSMSGRAPGVTPGDSRPAPAGDRSPRPGPSGWMSRSSAGAERLSAFGRGGR